MLLTILIMGVVSAGDTSDFNGSAILESGRCLDEHVIYADNIYCDDLSLEDDLEVENTDLLSNEYMPKTSNEIQNCVDAASNGDTIIFNGSYLIESTIEVNKAITFVGVNDATIDGNNLVRLFNVSAYGVVFKNITFKNGNSLMTGGAIYSTNIEFNTSIQNSRFVDNFAKNYGGAIYNGNALNCTFINCSVSKNAGGAIYNGNAWNCSFINNSADSAGGAIFRGSAVDCRFVGNKVYRKNGGAICDCDAINCSFVNNYANDNGGAIYNGNAWNCTFIGNTVTSYGGAMYGGNAWNCSFLNCSSRSSGGAIRDTYAWNCRFVNNYAKNYGGAILYGGAFNCSFVDNVAYAGGAIFFNWGDNAVNCTFINNSASNNGYGGAMNNGTALNCIFINNSAPKSWGGATNYVYAVKCIFIENYAYIGGAMARGSAVNCSFVRNAASYGGALRDNDAINCSFINNSAKGHGGAISLFNQKNVINCYFEGNTANFGAVIRIENGSNITLENLTCINNYAETYGGVLDAKGSNLTIKNCNFTDCYCNQNEGGALSFDTLNNLTIVNCNFNACHSRAYGGAIRVEASNNVFMDNLRFIDCYSQRGGSVYIGENDKNAHSSNITLSNCNFVNSSSDYGGSISCMGETKDFNLLNSSFWNSSSNIHSGAVDCYKIANVNIKDCEFINSSSVSSGTIRLYSVSGVNIGYCEFENCSSTNEGGAIYANEAENLMIEDSSFKDCNSFYGDYINMGDVSDYCVVDCIFDVIPEGIDYYYDSIIDVDDLSIVQGVDAILAVKLSNILGPLSNKIITFAIEGETFTKRTFSDGSTVFDITDYLPSLGEYNVTIGYEGEGKFKSVSKTIAVHINTLIANLTFEKIGKYYMDTVLAFKLTDSKTGNGIDHVPVMVTFSNGKTVRFSTGSNGEYSYRVPFIPGIYGFKALVDMNNVGVNAIESDNLNIEKIAGEIDISFTKGKRDINVILFNPINHDFYRNVKVILEFSNGAYTEIITGSDGIATYTVPFDIGNYSVLAYVDDEYTEFPITEFNGIEITEESGPVNLDPSKISLGNNIVFDYKNSGYTTFATVGCSIRSENVLVVNHPEIRPKIVGNRITVSGLDVGNYVLRVVTTPDEGYYSVIGQINITVNKISAVGKASKLTVVLKKGTLWTVKITDSKTGKPIAGLKLTLKVYTGSKFKTVSVSTNSKGIASYQTKGLTKGNHKVVVTSNQAGYKLRDFTSYINVIKPKALKFKLKKNDPTKKATLISFQILDKKTKKGVNGVKVKVKIYTGKKYKTFTLKSKKVSKVKGIIGFATNEFSAGKHKVVIEPVSLKYSGSGKTTMVIKKSAKKYPKKTFKV